MKSLLAMVATAATLCAFAQDDDFDFDVGGDDSGEQAIEAVGDGDVASDDSDASAGEEDGEEVAAPSGKKNAKGTDKILKTLPFCHRLEGKAEVRKPGADIWQSVEEGRFYPLGSSFRTTDATSRVKIQFGDSEDISVEINQSVASFGTVYQPLGEKTRSIVLKSGVVTVKLPRNMPDGAFSVAAPGFTIKNPKGVSRYYYNATVDGDVAQIRCVTGSLAIEGRNFYFPEVKTASEVKIRTSQDQLFTGLYGNRGDSIVRLDQGERLVKDFSTGETVTEKKPLEWKLSPKTAVRIHRALPNPDISKRMSVTVMTFDAVGSLKNRCAFAEGLSAVNTGELGPSVAVAKTDDSASRAAEAADVEAVDADVEDVDVGDSDSSDAGEDSTGGDASEDASAGGDDFEF